MSEASRRLNILKCTVVYTGTNAKGNEFHIHEVMATKPDGSPVELPLRSFDNLPLGEADYLVEQYVGKTGETSYTLKIPGGGRRGAPATSGVEQRLAAVEQGLALLKAQVEQASAGRAPASPVSTPPAPAIGQFG